MLYILQVEELEDIQKVSDVVSSSTGGEEGKPTSPEVTREGTAEATDSKVISAADLPPHAVIGMPALSPTMVITSTD